MRMAVLSAGLCAAATALTPVLAAGRAADTAVVAPSSPWQADFGDESCALKRTFGDGDDLVMLELRKFGPVAGTQVTVFGPGLAPTGEPLVIRLPGHPDSASPKLQINRVFEGGHRGITATVPITPETGKKSDAAASEPFRIESGFAESFALDAGSLEKPIAVLFHCTSNLLKVWGLTKSVDDKRPKMARLTNGERIQQELREKYNGLTQTKRMDGRLKLRILVDAGGRPTSCHDQDLGEVGQFAETACQTVLRLARFTPGEIDAGTPTASYYLFSATYANR